MSSTTKVDAATTFAVETTVTALGRRASPETSMTTLVGVETSVRVAIVLEIALAFEDEDVVAAKLIRHAKEVVLLNMNSKKEDKIIEVSSNYYPFSTCLFIMTITAAIRALNSAT